MSHWLIGKALCDRIIKDGYPKLKAYKEIDRIKKLFKQRGLYKGIVQGMFTDDGKPPFPIPRITHNIEMEKIVKFEGRTYLVMYMGAGSWAFFRKTKEANHEIHS